MIRPEALTRLRLLVGASLPPLVAGERNREVAPLQPGQAIDGRVEQQVAAGYVVSIRGRRFTLQLPDGTRPGDLLRLVYVNDNPRPTFALLRIEHANVGAGSELSEAGKFLSMLQGAGSEATEEPALRAPPVFDQAIPATPQASARLREALALSGLFYESHQAEWVLGTRPTAQLLREPQGRLGGLQSPGAEASGQSTAPADGSEPPAPAANSGPAGLPETASREQPAHSPAHPDTFPIIRQQLHALESGHVVWQGVIWPGQVMEWQVADGAAHPDQGDAGSRPWRTEVKLLLPNIGEVVARIEIEGNGAKVSVVADTPDHAQRLRDDASALGGRFGACGLRMSALDIRHGSQTT